MILDDFISQLLQRSSLVGESKDVEISLEVETPLQISLIFSNGEEQERWTLREFGKKEVI